MIRKIYSLLPLVLMISVSFMILSHPEISSGAVTDGLMLCVNRVIPSLFPFMVISSFLVSAKLLFKVTLPFSFLFSPIFKISPQAFQAILLGSFCGFPVGAYSLSELYQKGSVKKEEAERLLPICNMCGPAFVIFFGEKAFPHIPYSGVILYFIQLLSALALLIISSVNVKTGLNTAIEYEKSTENISFSKALINSVGKALKSSCTVCGFVILFYFFNDMLMYALGSIALLKTPLVFISGILEVTCGMTSVSLLGKFSFCAASFFICFGGISVAFQTYAAISQELSQGKYILGKIYMGLFGSIVGFILSVVLGFF